MTSPVCWMTGVVDLFEAIYNEVNGNDVTVLLSEPRSQQPFMIRATASIAAPCLHDHFDKSTPDWIWVLCLYEAMTKCASLFVVLPFVEHCLFWCQLASRRYPVARGGMVSLCENPTMPSLPQQ